MLCNSRCYHNLSIIPRCTKMFVALILHVHALGCIFPKFLATDEYSPTRYLVTFMCMYLVDKIRVV